MNSPDVREPSGEFFLGWLWFATGADLGLGFGVVGVVEELAAGFAVRPVDPGVTTAVIPIDTALGGEGVVFGAGFFFAFPAAGVLGHFFLGFALLALAGGDHLRGLLRFPLVLLCGGACRTGQCFGGNNCSLERHQGLGVHGGKVAAVRGALPHTRGLWWSILVRHHDGDGGLRVVHVERATLRDQLHEAGGPVVGVLDVQSDRDVILAAAAADDREAQHPDDVPEPAGFVLGGDVGRDGNVGVEYCAGQEHGKLDAGFLRGLGDFDLHAVCDGLCPGVGVDDLAKVRAGLAIVFGLIVFGAHGVSG